MSNTNNTMQTQTSNALHNAIMEASGKDRPPMLAPDNYVQCKSLIKRYIDTKPNNELIHYCLQNPPYKFKWAKRTIPIIEAVQLILIDLETNLYWEFGKFTSWDSESLESYYSRFYKMVNDLNEVNKIRVERLARIANPLALVAQQQPVYHPQPHLTHYTQNSSTRSQQATTRNSDDALSKEKEIDRLMALISLSFKKIYKPTNNNLITSSNTSRENEDNTPRINRGTGYDNQRAVNVAGARENVAYHKEKMLLRKQEEAGVQLSAEQVDLRDDTDDEPDIRSTLSLRAERLARTANLLALVAQQQPVYHPQNHPTHYTHNSSTRSQQAATRNRGKAIVNSPPPTYDQEPEMVAEDDALGTRYDNQRAVNVVEARENVGMHFSQDGKKQLCKQEQAYFSINQKQANWRDDTDDEPEDHELEAHYLYMAQIQEVTPDAADNSRPIFDAEPLQKDDQDKDDDLARERDLLVSLIEKLKCEIDDSKNHNKFLESSNKILVDKLKEEMVADLRYFISLEHEVDSLISQLETQKTQFLNEIDRLSREYYYVDHMNAILGVYTTLDEFTDLQCDYVDQVAKCERLENKLSKRNTTSKFFEALQQHAVNLELALQQNLKAQLQDKDIAISELKKLIEKMKGKFMETKFEKPSVIRQPNAFKSQRQSVLGVIPTTSVSRPQLKSNRLEDRVMHNNSEWKKQQVEDHQPTNLRKSIVSNTPSSSNSFAARRDNFIHHRLWVLKAHDGKSKASKNVTIKRVYYVEGLNHNLFSVGQFCDADLEVAFRKSTCYIRDLKGNDLLIGSCATDLYSITLQDTSAPNPICLMAKASTSQA
ncbi:hypothetical protein Tco_1154727 [Tanacetum coccineum]